MKTLAIDCATSACSVALIAEGKCVAGEWRELGRGHAEHLVPMIAALPERGKSDRVLVSCGPGSFTGVRIGLAAACALGLTWSVPVTGYSTMALIAAMARRREGDVNVSVCMDGGHGQWFVQNFSADGLAQDELQSLSPKSAVETAAHALVAGSQAEHLVESRKSGHALRLLPDAREAGALAEANFLDDLTPLYGRTPDAKLPTKP